MYIFSVFFCQRKSNMSMALKFNCLILNLNVCTVELKKKLIDFIQFSTCDLQCIKTY